MKTVALCLVVAFFGCKSLDERLAEEGYVNIRAVAPLERCPGDNPDLLWSFVAERGGKSWEIKQCCHNYTCWRICGKVMWTQTCKSCTRYTRELRAEVN